MDTTQTKQKIKAAYELLMTETTTKQKFDHIQTLLKGLNPQIDKKLEACSRALSHFEKLGSGDIIELSADALPESTEEQKRKKRALLFFIRSWKQLQGEVERVKNELEKEQTSDQKRFDSLGRIIYSAKGPFGIITLAAIVIAAIFMFIGSKQTGKPSNVPEKAAPVSPSTKPKIQAIEFQDKKIALSELSIRQGPDCISNGYPVQHYHAKNHIATKALDGTVVADPGACGYGKVSDVAILEVE